MSRPNRQPPEWGPHAACWLAWPSHEDLWEEAIHSVRRSFVEMCRAIVDMEPGTGRPRGERLEILVLDEDGEEQAQSALSDLSGIRFHQVPFGDIWLRDTAPVFVDDGNGILSAACFRFNGWGGKYDLPGDKELSARISDLAGVRRLQIDLVAEGGAIEVDGEGTCITTRQCLLNENRNPGMTEVDVEKTLNEALGIERVIWLDEGLANDHTDGHVDNLARFVGPGKVACIAPEQNDPNRRVLEEIRAALAAATDASGRRLDLIELPSVGELRGEDGRVMPASYMNFYVANRAVVVPIYGGPADRSALGVIEAAFPDRRVVGIDARALLEGGGAFHCISQQQPSSAGKEGVES